MSRTVDQRVVEMRFDNKDFESNVQTSMSTLDRLKQALNFGDAGKAFEGISKAAAGFNIGGIGDAVDTVKEKFSALEVAGVTALVNLTNKAVDAGAQMVKSLTIDQVTAGFDKYAEKTTAVQTIMAATKSQFSDEAEQMAYVNEQLDKLNWFTDETSYNLVDMVSNIGKFTNAGISLDSAVTSMQGVATWAAISGANAQEASRAMYNLAQATGTGFMQLVDWKSIENANMATLEFKEMAIQAGLALGTLQEVDGEIQTVDTGLAKKYSMQTVTAQNFASTLTSGAWLTTDVLNKVLDMYGGFTDALNAAYNETGLETIKLLKYTEDFENGLLDLGKVAKETGLDSGRLSEIFTELSSPTYELGRRAFKAAQETKTFAEVIAYTKDAVSSGWMNTFELIFGDYEEAKAMWSDLSEVFYEIFVASGDARNEMLEAWKELGGRTSMLEAVSNAYGAVVKVIETLKEAFHDIFPARDSEEKGQALFNLTERVREFTSRLILTDDAAQKLKGAVTPLFQLLKRGLETIRGVGTEMKEVLFPAFKSIIDSTKNIVGPLGRVISTFKDLIKYAIEPFSMIPRNIWSGFTSGLPGLLAGFDDMSKKAAMWLTNFNETLLTSEKLHKALDVISNVMADIGRGVSSFLNLTNIIYSFKTGGGGISGVLSVIDRQLKVIWNTITTIVERITGIDISEGIIGKIADGISGALDKIREAFEHFKRVDTSGVDKVREDTEKKLGPVASLFDGIKKVLSGIWGFLKQLAPVFSAVASVIGSALGKIGEGLSNAMSNFDAGDVLDLANGGILVAIGLGIKKLIGWINELKDGEGIFSGVIKSIKDTIGSITDTLDAARGALEAWQQNLKASTLLKLAAAIGVITLSVLTLSQIDPEKLATAITAITFEFGELMGAMEAFSKISAGIQTKAIAKAGVVMIELAFAVLILTSAVKSLSELDWNDVIEGLSGVAVLCYTLARTINRMDLDGISFTKGTGLLLLAFSVRVLASAVKSLAELSWGDMIEGLAGVGALCFELSQTLNRTDFSGLSISKSVGILILAASLKVMASAVEQMTELSWGDMIKGLLGVGALLLGLSLFLNNTKLDSMSISSGLGLVLFAASLKIMASAVEQMAELEWGEIIRGLVGMGGVLLEVVGFMKLLEKTGTSGGELIAVAAGMVVMGLALSTISDIMLKFGQMSLESIIKSLVELAGVLLLLALGAEAMEGSLGGAAAMLVMAAALAILSPVMLSFASLEWEQIIKSLVELAGIFVILGVAGAVLGPLTPIILALSAAIVLLGIGVTGIGAGVALLGAGLAAVASAGTAAIVVLVELVEGLILMIPEFIAALGEGLIELIKIIGDSATEIANTVIKIGKAVLLTLRELIPDLVDTVIVIVDELLKTLVEHGPSIIDSIMILFEMLLSSLAEHLPVIIDFVIDAILQLLAAITERIPDFVQAGFDIVINLIDGLGQALVDNAPRLRDAFLGLLGNLLKAILAFFGIHSPSTVFADIGEKLILGLIEGIKGLALGAVNAIKKVASDMIQGIKNKLAEFKQKGKELIEKIKSGIADKAEELKTKMSETVAAVKDKISEKVEEFKEKGKELINKIRDGMTDEQREAFDKAVEVVKGIKDKIGEKLSWFEEKGGEIIDILKSGMSASEKIEALKTSIKGTIGEIKDSAKKKIEEFTQVGKDILNGLINGITSAWEEGKNLVTGVWGGIVDGVKDFFDINSPSKVMEGIGENVTEGLALGISEEKSEAIKAAIKTASGITNAIEKNIKTKNAVKKVFDDAKKVADRMARANPWIPTMPVLAEEESLAVPVMPILAEEELITGVSDAVDKAGEESVPLTLTPVVDMNSVENELANSEKEINGTYELSIKDIANINASGYDSIKNEIRLLNNDIDRYVLALRDDVKDVKNTIKQMKIIMDTGALVGAMSEKMNNALGRIAVLEERGV